MKKLYLLATLAVANLMAYSQGNLVFKANLPYAFSLANIGGYVDSQGNEYALVGTYQGLSIVDVTIPTNPIEKFTVPGISSDWREVKTWSTYAYVTTEGGGGLRIVDLSNLPASINYKYYTGDGAINGQLNTIHALHIDNGYAYLYGSNLFSGAAVICDLNADPWNPHYLGHTPGNYIHDGYVRNDTLYAGHIYQGYMRVYDCTNKANPVLLATQLTPGQFTHNTWLSANSKYVFTTDEVNNSYLTAYDISNLSNITEVARFQTTPGTNSIVHNTHILQANGGEFAVTSWYKDGVVITDVTRPENLVQIARYDTYTQGSGSGFNGCWGVYPFLPSGTIVASDIDNGLYVLTPNYVRACYLEGVVTDNISGLPLNNVTVQVLTAGVTVSTKITGEYKTGTAAAGTYDVQYSKSGYVTKTISGVQLISGQVTIQDVQLDPVSTAVFTGQVVEAGTLAPVDNAIVYIRNATVQSEVHTNAGGNFAITNFINDTYELFAGKWGYRTTCLNTTLNAGNPLQIIINKGYYDDFILDFDWTVSGVSTNSWERGEPVGTTYQGTQANPNLDVTNDCGDYCFVTDNGGGGPWDNDVDNGNTVLTSPVFDATIYTNPQLNYYRWFANLGNNGGGNPDDTMTVKITNGITTVTLESIFPNSPNNSSWVSRQFIISNYITPTPNMQVIVETADWGPVFNIVEGGYDKFEVIEGPTSVSEFHAAENLFSVAPNPFQDELNVRVSELISLKNPQLEIRDVTGRLVWSQHVTAALFTLRLNGILASGIYSLALKDGNEILQTVKICKPN